MVGTIGRSYVNKTLRFLAPSLEAHGNDFIEKFNPLWKLAYGIHDSYLDGSDITQGNNIYVMVDTLHNSVDYLIFKQWIEEQPYYKGGYMPDEETRKYVFIIEIPKVFHNAYEDFLKGRYSYMYSEKNIERLFSGLMQINDAAVLTKKDDEYLRRFKVFVDKQFNTDIDIEDFRAGEWELPLVKTEEIFNYVKSDTVFFNDLVDKVWKKEV